MLAPKHVDYYSEEPTDNWHNLYLREEYTLKIMTCKWSETGRYPSQILLGHAIPSAPIKRNLADLLSFLSLPGSLLLPISALSKAKKTDRPSLIDRPQSPQINLSFLNGFFTAVVHNYTYTLETQKHLSRSGLGAKLPIGALTSAHKKTWLLDFEWQAFWIPLPPLLPLSCKGG